jgi:heme-degrading monooxygenase HmoA
MRVLSLGTSEGSRDGRAPWDLFSPCTAQRVRLTFARSLGGAGLGEVFEGRVHNRARVGALLGRLVVQLARQPVEFLGRFKDGFAAFLQPFSLAINIPQLRHALFLPSRRFSYAFTRVRVGPQPIYGREERMHARVTTLQMDPGKIDDAIAGLEENDIPMFKDLDGFKGFSLMVDRSSGKCIGLSYWESEDAMKASEESVKDSRARAAETGGASAEPDVERYEVAIDTQV